MPKAIVINLFDPDKDSLLYKMASEFEGDADKAYVFAHGVENFPALLDSTIDPPVIYGADAAKELLLKAGVRQDTQVVLFACDTGKSIDGALSLARQLSQWFELVKAPTRNILVEHNVIPILSIPLGTQVSNDIELQNVTIQDTENSKDHGIWKTFRRQYYDACIVNPQKCDSPATEISRSSEILQGMSALQGNVSKQNATVLDLAAFIEASADLTSEQKALILARVSEHQNTVVL